MKYYIRTFGCQQNIADSQQIEIILQKQGYQKAPSSKEADLIVVNACSVRKSATDRAYAKIKQNKKAGKKVILAGCVTEHDRQNLKGFVDEIWTPDDYFCVHPQVNNNFSAFIPIMTGCNNFCSYCVVPYVRGREKSRPTAKIIADIKRALKNGAKEIILLGQNVNSYHYESRIKNQELRKTTNFSDLLREINNLPGDFWLTFTSNHPKDINSEMIETMAKCQKVSPVMHLPVQSGDNAILKKMNRHYTASQYKKLIKKIRTIFKKYRSYDLPLSLSTDFIVGFAGETKKQFSESAKLMKEISFDMAYLNCYSPRPGTVAAKLTDNVPSAEKRKRENILNEILKKTARKNNQTYLKKTVDVLIAEIKGNYGFGKTKTQKNVKVKITEGVKRGDIIKVKIDKVESFRLYGMAISKVKC